MRLMAMLNVVLGFLKILSMILLVVGVYYSYKEFRKEKSRLYQSLENKWYLRALKIVGFLAYFAALAYLVGEYVNAEIGFMIVFVYIFAVRIVKKAFLYVIFGSESKAININHG